MAKKAVRKAGKSAARKSSGTPAAARGRSRGRSADALLAPVAGAESRTVGRVRLDVGQAGNARVKRMIYPPGFRWSKDMKGVVGTDLCMHGHAGFLAKGQIHIEYADGCVVEHKAPQIIAISPGHDGWVVGNEPVVMIEFDFERETVKKLGMKPHRH